VVQRGFGDTDYQADLLTNAMEVVERSKQSASSMAHMPGYKAPESEGFWLS
jgi:hypothetical protein